MAAPRASIRPRVAAVLVAVQVAIPVAAYADGVPSRFGFHMFSGREQGLQVVVLDDAGSRLEVDLDDYVASGRPELDWTASLPDYICAHEAQAAVVTVTSGDERRTVTCPAR